MKKKCLRLAAGSLAVLMLFSCVWPVEAAKKKKTADRAEELLMLIEPEQDVEALRDSFYEILEDASMRDAVDTTDFTLADLDGDGIRELILITDETTFDIYTGVEGEARWVGSYEQALAELYKPKTGSGVYAVRDRKGKRYVDRITIEEDDLDTELGPQLAVEQVSVTNKAGKNFKDGTLLETYDAGLFIMEGDELVLQEEEEYIFPDGNKRYLTYDDLVGLDARTLRLGRNEFYARRGRIFQSSDLGVYFRSKSWYNPTISASDFDENVFNKYEMYNINFIWEYEQKYN